MYHFFVTPNQIGPKQIQIEGSDVNHIRNVLRMVPGEEITISSGSDGKEYFCRISTLEEDLVTAEIIQIREAVTELSSRLALIQGLPKNDKMEWIIQKAVELGAAEIVPMATKRAVVKLDAKKEESKRKRWNAISESAAKQSKRTVIPEVKPVLSFRQAVDYAAASYDVCLIPYELADGMEQTRKILGSIQPGKSAAILIGPEGGFEEEEVAYAQEKGVIPITLGHRILRTETAGLAVLSALMLQLDDRFPEETE